MLQEDSTTLPPAPCICLVAPDADACIADSILREAADLARRDWQTHVLCCACTAGLLPGVAFHQVGELSQEDVYRLPGPAGFPPMHASDRVRWALAELHRRHAFDAIQFPDRGGLGFRTIQAKRQGLDFRNTLLSVKVYGPSQHLRHLNKEWPDQAHNFINDYCERYAFERADRTLCDDAMLLDDVKRLGWNLPTRGCSNFPEAQRQTPLVTVVMPFFNLAQYVDEALASLAGQDYPALEVFVIDDGSTEPAAQRVFHDMKDRFPQFRFLEQANAGIGATRNRGLELGGGKYFLPMDADNVARPDMISRLVDGLERNPDLAALSCYFLAFTDSESLAKRDYLYAYRPIGGPYVLGALRNVFGDANALFRTEALRSVGGFETDRDTSWEDWELFVKLVAAGLTLDVLPDFLFYYRHRQAGFSRVTCEYQNHQRVLRQFIDGDHWPRAERLALWNMLAGLHRRVHELEAANQDLRASLQSLRYQLMDGLRDIVRRVPFVPSTMRWLKKRLKKTARNAP